MKYCRKCVQPDTRPGIVFDENGVCAACLWQEDHDHKVDWDERSRELTGIVAGIKEKARSTDSPYDCVIGVSGGKDSVFQALYARDRLGLHSLLVNCEPEGISDIGRKNIENIKSLGFDTISIRPNPKVMKKLIVRDFFRHGNPVKVTEYALWSSAYIIAERFGIPLIIQGENQGLTMGTEKGFGKDDDALKAKRQHTVEKDYLEEYAGEDARPRDLFFYNYDEGRLRGMKIRAIWVQYYAKEWSSHGNGMLAVSNGLSIRDKGYSPKEIGQYWRFNALDAGGLVYVNQMLKYIKYGFGATTDSACYDLRENRITRGEAIKLVQEFDGGCAERYVEEFCRYVDITTKKFWETADSYRGEMWEKKAGKWSLVRPLWEQEDVTGVSIDHILQYHRDFEEHCRNAVGSLHHA